MRMVNLETLKQEIYQREKKRLFRRFLFVNFLVVLFLSITWSGTKVTERERELIGINRELAHERDSIKSFTTNELISMKEKENELIRKSLSISMDTTYIDKNLNISNTYEYAKSQENTYASIEKIIDNKWDSINSIPSGMPLSLAELYGMNDGFGYRKHPIYKTWLFHEGVDLSALVGSEVFAAGNGIVERFVKNDRGWGNMIIINHQNGYRTIYAHLERFNVVVGQKVNKHDVIAYSGNTGSSTGPHLHYEILLKNRPINPENFFHISDPIKTYARK